MAMADSSSSIKPLCHWNGEVSGRPSTFYPFQDSGVPSHPRNPQTESNLARSVLLTYLIEFPNGIRVLFDPVFDLLCSPSQLVGPRRYSNVPCRINDIPYIDAVVISHNHYDHLSYSTVKDIVTTHPDCHFFAPFGNQKWFRRHGITKVTELDWWEARSITLSLSITTTDEVEEGRSIQVGEAKARNALGCVEFD